MKFLLATQNRHKLDEIALITPKIDFTGISQFSANWEVEETGETFEENSLIKARSAALYFGMYTVADDSGLEIKSLGGFPGVRSARFMEGSSYVEKMSCILEKMEHMKLDEERAAQFRTVAVFYDPLNGNTISVEGVVAGVISYEIKGEGGFGYDPIFIPNGFEKTFGELPEEIKNSFSHRARAFKELEEKLRVKGYLR